MLALRQASEGGHPEVAPVHRRQRLMRTRPGASCMALALLACGPAHAAQPATAASSPQARAPQQPPSQPPSVRLASAQLPSAPLPAARLPAAPPPGSQVTKATTPSSPPSALQVNQAAPPASLMAAPRPAKAAPPAPPTAAAQAGRPDALARHCATIRGEVELQASGLSGHRLDHTRSLLDLTGMAARMVPGRFVLGYTWTEARVQLATEFKTTQDPRSSRECVAPRVKVTLSYEPIVIYIGREFVPGSCAYEAVLAHEMRHLNAYRAHYAAVEAQLRASLRRHFEVPAQPVPLGQGQARLEQDIEQHWLPAIKAELQKAEAQQRAIDSPQEQARLSKVCQGEVQSIIKSVGTARR